MVIWSWQKRAEPSLRKWSKNPRKMTLAKPRRYLLDVNAFVALIDENHVHHQAMTVWFNRPGRQWAICAFTEAGFLRHATRPGTGKMSMKAATAILEDLAKHPGYHYLTVSLDWRTLTKPFFKYLQGHKQITDAYLLGLALHEELVLATFDQGIRHLAGEYGEQIHLLSANEA